LRVLLVQSKWTPVREPLFPLGLIYVATALIHHKHEVRIDDSNVSADPVVGLRKLVRDFEPEVIGVGLRNFDTVGLRNYRSFAPYFFDLISALKQALPKSRIVAGGSGFSLYARQLMERAPVIDYGIVGEGEEAMTELLDNLDNPESVRGIFYRTNGTVNFSGTRKLLDFAKSPAPRWNLVDFGPYLQYPFSIGVQTKRGCPFSCAYCIYPQLEGNVVRARPAKVVVDELEKLAEENGLRTFSFVDSVFSAPKSYARAILEEMLARGLKLRWRGYDDLRSVDTEYIKLARDAGCDRFEFSPDGFSSSALTALNKNISEQDIKRAYTAIKKTEGTKAIFNFAVNGPGESLGNLVGIAIFLARLKLILRERATLSYNYIRIYPHTRIHAIALEKGLVGKDDDLFRPTFYNPPPRKYFLAIVDIIMDAIVTPIARRIFAALRKLTG
jgi:anaerobic magnesium-protoporphyrin IX monomethyl ester cyclase